MGALAQAGVELVGENRLQDLEEKHERWDQAFTWDFIGNVQSRKVKRILPLVRLIHSVASDSVLEIARQNVPPGLAVNLDVGTRIDTGAYFSATDAFGSPAWSESELASSGETERQSADQLLANASGLRLGPATTSDQGHRTCLNVPKSPTGSRPQPLPPGTYTLTSPTETSGVRLGRFAVSPTVDLGSLPPGRTVTLVIPSDRSSRPWRLVVVGSGGLSLCSASQF
jgi:hypothetical protein